MHSIPVRVTFRGVQKPRRCVASWLFLFARKPAATYLPLVCRYSPQSHPIQRLLLGFFFLTDAGGRVVGLIGMGESQSIGDRITVPRFSFLKHILYAHNTPILPIQLSAASSCGSDSASPVREYTKTLLDLPLSGIAPIGSAVTRSLTCS